MAFMMMAVFAGLFLAGQAAAAGLDSNLVAGLTIWQGLIGCAIVAIIGVVILVTSNGKSMAGWMVFLVPVVVAFLVVAWSLSAPIDQNQTTPGTATYDVTDVAATHANYTAASKLITAVVVINKTAPSMNETASHVYVNFTIVRTDAGSAFDVRSVGFSYSPSSITSASTGISYSVVKPNSDGRPNCNWTIIAGSSLTTSSRTLSGSAGMTPYQTINVGCNIEYNPNALGVSQTAVNDVLNLGTFNIAGISYSLQAVVSAVWA